MGRPSRAAPVRLAANLTQRASNRSSRRELSSIPSPPLVPSARRHTLIARSSSPLDLLPRAPSSSASSPPPGGLLLCLWIPLLPPTTTRNSAAPPPFLSSLFPSSLILLLTSQRPPREPAMASRGLQAQQPPVRIRRPCPQALLRAAAMLSAAVSLSNSVGTITSPAAATVSAALTVPAISVLPWPPQLHAVGRHRRHCLSRRQPPWLPGRHHDGTRQDHRRC